MTMPGGPVDPALLVQSWAHSHEEDTASEMVFRPKSFKFGPSRGRRSIDLGPDGVLHDASPGQDDRPRSRAGSRRATAIRPATGAPAEPPQRRLVITSVPARLNGVSAEFVDQLRKVGATADASAARVRSRDTTTSRPSRPPLRDASFI